MNNLNDIIIYGNTLHLSEAFIIRRSDYKAEYLQNHRNNKALKSWKWIKHYGVYFYEFDKIPNNASLGHRDDLLLQAVEVADERLNSFRTAFEQFCEDEKSLYVDYYRYEIEYKMNAERAHEICQAHGVVITIGKWEVERRYKDYGISKAEMWDCMREVASSLCPYTFNMKNSISLQNKVKKLPKEPEQLRDALISKRIGNQSARKVGREDSKIVDTETGEVFEFDIHKVLFFQYWMNPYKANKLTKRMVYDKYLIACGEQGVKPVSLSTVKSYINKNRHWMSLERDGSDVYQSQSAPYIPQAKLKYSGSLWAADYSGIKLLYNDNGTARSPYMLRIIDVASEKIVGYALTDSGEDWQTVIECLKEAVDNNDGKAAVEFITDNGGAFISKNIRPRLAQLFSKHRPITLGNKQANPSEMYVKFLSDKARQFDNWSMLGFATSFKNIENRANEDRMNILELPTKAEVYQQADELVKMWNNEVRPNGRVPSQFHAEATNPKLQPISDRTYRYAFGVHTEKAFATARSIISVRHEGGFLKFNVPNWDEALALVADNSTDKNMTVKMVFDKTGADLYSSQGKFLMTLVPVKYSHKGVAEKTVATEAAYKDHRGKKKDHKTKVEKRIDHLVDAVEAIPMPYGMVAQLNGNAKENSQALENKAIAKEKEEDTPFDLDEFQFNHL